MNWKLLNFADRLWKANQHIGALELTVYKQQQQLDLFQGQLRKIWSQLQGAAGDDGAALATDPRDDIPPALLITTR
jgi:uncharacterized coiled-coil protein SlyX